MRNPREIELIRLLLPVGSEVLLAEIFERTPSSPLSFRSWSSHCSNVGSFSLELNKHSRLRRSRSHSYQR